MWDSFEPGVLALIVAMIHRLRILGSHSDHLGALFSPTRRGEIDDPVARSCSLVATCTAGAAGKAGVGRAQGADHQLDQTDQSQSARSDPAGARAVADHELEEAEKAEEAAEDGADDAQDHEGGDLARRRPLQTR